MTGAAALLPSSKADPVKAVRQSSAAAMGKVREGKDRFLKARFLLWACLFFVKHRSSLKHVDNIKRFMWGFLC